MPEITCKYNYNVPKTGYTSFGKVLLEFPMPENKLNKILADCDTWQQKGIHYLYELKWSGDEYIFEGAERNSCGIEEIYNLNAFAKRLSEMDDTQRLKLYGLYKHDCDRQRLNGKGGSYYPNLEKCVNMTYNLDNIEVDRGLSTAAELGQALVENEMVIGLGALSDTVKKYLDYAKIGEEFCRDKNGIFVKNSLVYDIPLSEQLHTPYQSRTMELAAEENTMDIGFYNM